MLIDDDQEILDLLSEYLQDHSFKTTGFNNPLRALKSLEKKSGSLNHILDKLDN